MHIRQPMDLFLWMHLQIQLTFLPACCSQDWKLVARLVNEVLEDFPRLKVTNGRMVIQTPKPLAGLQGFPSVDRFLNIGYRMVFFRF
jgi:hypothetical protein